MKKNYFFLTLAIITSLISCKSTSFDPELGMSQGEYEDNLTSSVFKEGGLKLCQTEAAIPRLSKIVAMPEDPKLHEEKRISISVTEDVSLVDLLLEIGKIADVDIVVDKDVDGSMFLAMKNRPLFEILDRICDMAGLRYSLKDGTIVVEYDTSYIQTYDVSFLAVTRSSSSNMNVSTSVLSGGGGVSGGSSASLSSSSQDTFWTDLTTNITQIINSTKISTKQNSSNFSSNSGNFGINQLLSGGQSSQSGQNSTGGSGSSSASGSASGQSGQNSTGAQGSQTGQTSGSQSSSSGTTGNPINLSKSSGMMSIIANKKGHEKIKQYLDEFKKKVSAQVLIEVKMAEVLLSKNFELGIDWSYAKTLAGKTSSISTTGLSSTSANIFAMSGSNKNGSGETITSALNILETFGVTKVLSSPRVVALNNQQLIVTFVDNQVFFEIAVTGTSATTATNGSVVPGTVSITSTTKTIPVGMVLTLQPSINLKDNTVMLNIRPTISKIIDYKDDVGFDFSAKKYLADAGSTASIPSNKIPITSVRELDTTLNMKSEDIMILGGFTEKNTILTEKGVPILSKIPLIKSLFSKKVETITSKEIVFIIKATVLNDGNNDLHEYDKYFYKTFFSNDPREFIF
jgi:type II secretory pathway component GspD/PulD (secretin)